MASWFELSKSTNDQFRFVLKTGNHQIIGASQMYASAQSRDAGIGHRASGIAPVKTNGSSKTIKEQIGF
ncbi:YegP family protein [Citrobacter amalonaticus]|uniref:YegP family protein n=1 Tax=Citrobacter amalonaticus TaxID=35703 RepID=UPI00165091C5|nr:YegP family protein [Citrobacter amalonaticus]MBC6532048.1 YegP family protein [Citrobacter amalonaticus]